MDEGNQIQNVMDQGEVRDPEQVHLVEPLVLEVVFVELFDVSNAWVVSDREHVFEGFVVEDDTRRMKPTLTGEPLDFMGEGNEFLVIGVAIDDSLKSFVLSVVFDQIHPRIHRGGKEVHLARWIPVHPPDVVDGLPRQNGRGGHDVGHAVFPVF